MKSIHRIKTISEFHRTKKLEEPEHPLISVIDYAAVDVSLEDMDKSWVLDFYMIALKRNMNGKIKYGQQEYDFDEGIMFFISPGQVYKIERMPGSSPNRSGWMLLIHPDFLWSTPLAKSIKQYEFFDYSINEALFLSKKEEATMYGIIENLEHEYRANIDKFSQNIIISQVETLLHYSERFYNRQFITRKKAAHKVVNRLEELLAFHFNSDHLAVKGLPTVQCIAQSLNLSPKYLSSLLKAVTGQNTQHHIHEKLIEKAKEKLSTTDLSVSEIAYELGFEHSQSFSKLFKDKTSLSPLEFRQSFIV